MNLEDQCISLELAKKLKELGVRQESLFFRFGDKGFQYLFCKYYEQYSPHVNLNIEDGYSSFTIAELFEIIPAFIDLKSNEPFNDFWFKLQKRKVYNIQYIVNYECGTQSINESGCLSDPIKLFSHNIYDENLANCLAKVLIHLIENKLIEVNPNAD